VAVGVSTGRRARAVNAYMVCGTYGHRNWLPWRWKLSRIEPA